MDIYKKLQKQLDAYSLGFPETKSGIEIDILKTLFSERDAGLFAQMSPILETPDSVAERIGADAAETAGHLEDMAKRGLLFRKRRGDSVRYGAIPFMHGLLEFQIKRFDREMAEKFERYFDEGFNQAIADNADHFLRVVPVNRSVEFEHHVSSFDDAAELLRNAPVIAVADCICRREKETVDKGCGRPMETCFMFGSMAEYYIDNDMGRKVDAEEAIAILKDAQDAGLVTQPATAQNPTGMCSCCGDCCGVLMSIKKHPRPAELVYSNHLAALDTDECTGCGACIDRCQMEALSMNSDGIAELDISRCIGCGLCVTACPSGALTLERKQEKEKFPLPKSGGEQMLTLAKKRGILP